MTYKTFSLGVCRSRPLCVDSTPVIYWLSNEEQEDVLSQPEALIESLEPRLSGLLDQEIFQLAAAYEFLGQSKKAKLLCRLALEKNLNHVPSLYALSLMSFRDSKNSEAKRFFSRALKRDEKASESILHFQKRLRNVLTGPQAGQWVAWCLEEIHRQQKSSEETRFELAKILFEQSRWNEAASFFEGLLMNEKCAYESSQYLSYIYERLYQGEELIERYLGLAKKVKERADLFFNLGMIFQNDRKQSGLSLHFFYLAHREDPYDPGLRFSLEQACMEQIGKSQDAKKEDEFLDLMFAHLYYGSVAVAERYARVLRDRSDWRFPESFQNLKPTGLWDDWLLTDNGTLGEALVKWFRESPVETWKIHGQD